MNIPWLVIGTLFVGGLVAVALAMVLDPDEETPAASIAATCVLIAVLAGAVLGIVAAWVEFA